MGEADSRDWTIEQAQRWRRLADELRRRLGAGVALDPAVRPMFEGRLGADVSGAMVHRGRLAGQLAHAVGAEAVTAGQHVLGSSEGLDPRTVRGAALLGHELTHVIQRTSGGSGDTARDESAAQIVEHVLADEATRERRPAAPINVEILAERVYRRLVDELLLERARAASERW